jgi:uncharacterized protein
MEEQVRTMIIDIHNHLGEPFGSEDRQTADDLLASMDANGIDRAVVFPFPFGNFDNDYVAKAVAQHPDRLIGLVMVVPWIRESIDAYIRRYTEEYGFRGVKLHLAAHGYKLSERAVVAPILEACSSQELPVLVYTGDELYAAPLQAMIAASDFPDVSFILAHSGFMMQTNDAVLVAQRCDNVYLEHSSGISLGLKQSVELLGAERVLYGSDSPYMDQSVELLKTEIAVPDPADRALVLAGNARRLLRV